MFTMYFVHDSFLTTAESVTENQQAACGRALTKAHVSFVFIVSFCELLGIHRFSKAWIEKKHVFLDLVEQREGYCENGAGSLVHMIKECLSEFICEKAFSGVGEGFVFCFCFSFVFLLIFSSYWSGTCSVDQVSLELTLKFSPLHLKYWDYRRTVLHPAVRREVLK